MSDDHPTFSPNKVFLSLFILTAAEVIWGAYLPISSKLLLWGGLLIMAFWKGLLIFAYFMHMKYEGWIVKCLLAPTPVLVLVVFFSLMPDVGSNARLDHEITDMVDPTTGEIITIGSRDGEQPGDEDAEH